MKLENLQPASGWKGLPAWTFRDPRPLANVAVIGLWVYLAGTVANIIGVGLEWQFVTSAMSGPPAGPLPAATLDMVTTATRMGNLALYMISGFIVLKWIYRTNANAHRMSNGLGMTVSPGWAIGWFFIPIANLWKPFQGVEQTWRVSHSPGAPGSVDTPLLLRWWWGLWLLSSIIANIAGRTAGDGSDLNLLAASDVGEMIADGLTIPLILILMKIIRAITAAQVERRNVADVFD